MRCLKFSMPLAVIFMLTSFMDPDNPFNDFLEKFLGEHFNLPDLIERDSKSLGSGFIISADGYILTNHHVVANADEILVTLKDKREFKAELIGSDKGTDTALVKIDSANLPTVNLGKAADLKVGEWVLAIGSPFGFEHSVTAGIVSAKGRSLPSENYVPFIQTDVAINPGNSGGPLFNLKGEVVGVNSQIFSRSGGFMGLKIIEGSPADQADLQVGDIILKFNGQIIERSSQLPPLVGSSPLGKPATVEIIRNGKRLEYQLNVQQLPDTNKVAGQSDTKSEFRDRVGLVVKNISKTQREQLGLDMKEGVLVTDVKAGAARLAGVKVGDIITRVNNRSIQSTADYDDVMGRAEPGRNVALLIHRDEKALFIPIRIPLQ
ncbi:MAG: trypsin-like peptidase domain-containing protein [Gammaproteobacteria bacterium]